MRSIAVGAAALMAATAAAVVPTVTASASASTGSSTKVVVNTVSNGHFDTTSESGSATFSSDNGPVWAIDSLKEKWTITPVSGFGDGANYTATLSVVKGSKFSEFADPGQPGCPGDTDGSAGGGPHAGTGNVLGTLEYDIQSSTAPDLSAVPAVQAPNTSLGAVLSQIFDSNQTVVGGGHYNFTYSDVCGTVYSQTG
jgi:hypothetical protein